MTEFYFNADYPGSGKTEAALRYAIQLCAQLDSKVIFVLQTIALIDELTARAQHIAKETHSHQVAITALHNANAQDAGGGVKRRIIDHTASTPHAQPEILFITLRAFLEVTPWPNKHVWQHVFVDEAFNPFEDLSIQLVENFRTITDRVALADAESEFSALKPVHGEGVRESVSNSLKRSDEVNKLLQPILSRLVSPHFMVYAHAATWKGIKDGEIDIRDPRLFLYAEINPCAFEGFNSVTFMGAWLENHAFFRLWGRMGHSFTAHPMLKELVCSRAWNRSDDTIIYFTERHWTSAYAKTPLPDGHTPLEHVDAYLRKELHGFDFGWTKNARQTIKYDGTYIPPRSAGLNSFQHLESLVWLASMLPHPNMWRFLNWRGLTDDEVRKEFYWLPMAQFMARGADRRRDYDGKMIKVVPDLPAARFLQEIFRSRLERAGTIPQHDDTVGHTGKAGRPKGHANRGGRPRSILTPDERRAQRNKRDRQNYSASKQFA